MSQARQPAIDRSAVSRELQKILAHAQFARSQRMARFLRLAVERTLEGRGEELKEYLIGVEVFDRKSSYDPRVDPIVRVEARRLRAKLKAYYEHDGAGDPVFIEFVTGSYAPRIRFAASAPPLPQAEPGLVTIAVLPFADLGPDPENEYFSDGLTEELIHALTRVSGMRVAAWNSASQLRTRQQDIQAIRQQLNVGAVLTGSVRIAGPSLRVRAQLIDTETGVYLWSETFDRQMQDVFAIQEEMARAIVRTLRVELARETESGLAVRNRPSIGSYDYYLKGRYFWHRRTPDDLARSIQYFEAAIEADPNSALAHAGLADGCTLSVDYGLLHPAEGMPKAESAASRAAALDSDLAEAYTSLALIRSHYHREWEEAELLYRRAIELNPGYATAHHWLGVDCYAILGQFDDAIVELAIAQRLDPLSGIIREGRPYISLLKREYQKAIDEYREIIEFDPSFYKGYTALGRAYAQVGRYQEALSMLEKGRSLAGDIPNILSAMGQVHGLAGEHQRAREMLAELAALGKTRYVPSTSFALVHLGLGEKEQALQWLEKACEQHDLPLSAIKVHPIWDPLRPEPRFRKLLNRMRLE